MALLDDLAQYMQSQGLGTYGTDIFRGGLTPTPVGQYALLETGGGSALRELDNLANIVDTPGVQVLARDTAYGVCSDRSWAAYYAFDDVLEVTLGSAVYKLTEPQQAPTILEWLPLDGEERPIFVFNLLVEVQR